MLADRPPIVGNQTGMDGFFPSGGSMGGHIGNQTEVMVTSGMRGAVTQYGAAGLARDRMQLPSGGSAVAPGDKDEILTASTTDYGAESALNPVSGEPGKSLGFLDGHMFLVLLGLGVIALVVWKE